jgi:TP901 family phage tail tape measure protein
VAEVAKGIIDIEINTGSAASALQALQAQINAFNLALNKGNKTQSQFSGEYSKKLQEAINKTGLFTAETIRLQTAAATLDKTLSKGKTSLGQYFSAKFNKDGAIAAETMALASERARRLQTQFIATSGAANGFQNALAVRPLAAFSSQAAIAGQKAEIMSAMFKQGTTQLINFGKNVQWAGRQLMVGFTVPLTIFGAVAGKTFMELEKQVVGFKKVYGDLFTTPADLEKNLEAVKGLASEYTKYGIAVKDTIGLAAQAAAAGRQGAELTDSVTQATRLATLGQMDQNAALETTISLQSAFKLSGQDLADTINFLNMVENQTVVSLQDIAAAIPRVAPVISGLGGDVKDLTVFLAAMQEGGVDAAEGANALKSGLASLINPTKQATAMLSGMGINLETIIQANKGDLMGTVQSFAQALGALDQFSRQQALEQVFGKFQYAKLGALFENISREGSQAQQVIATLGYTTEQLASTADKELKTIEESFGVQLTGAVERFKLAIAPIGEIFVKLAIPLVNFATKIAEAFNGLSDGQKKFAAIGAVIVGVVVPAVTMLTGLFLNLVGTLAKMTQGVTLFGKGLITGGPIGAMKALSQSSKYLSLAEMDAAMAAQQLAGASQALNATLVQQVGTSNAAAAAIGNLTRAYAAMIATQAGAASAFPEIFGTAGAAGTAAKTGQVRIRGVRIQKRNSGGPIFMSNGTTVPGSGNTDTVPAMLTPGEFVVNKESTKNNLGLLHNINDSKKPQGLNVGGKAKGVQYLMAGKLVKGMFDNIPGGFGGILRNTPLTRVSQTGNRAALPFSPSFVAIDAIKKLRFQQKLSGGVRTSSRRSTRRISEESVISPYTGLSGGVSKRDQESLQEIYGTEAVIDLLDRTKKGSTHITGHIYGTKFLKRFSKTGSSSGSSPRRTGSQLSQLGAYDPRNQEKLSNISDQLDVLPNNLAVIPGIFNTQLRTGTASSQSYSPLSAIDLLTTNLFLKKYRTPDGRALPNQVIKETAERAAEKINMSMSQTTSFLGETDFAKIIAKAEKEAIQEIFPVYGFNAGGKVPGYNAGALIVKSLRRRVRPGKEQRRSQQKVLQSYIHDPSFARDSKNPEDMNTLVGMLKPLTQQTRATRGTVLGSTKNPELPYAQQKRIVAAIKEGRYEDLFGMKLNFKGPGSYTTRRETDFAPFIGDLSNPTLKSFSHGFMDLKRQKEEVDKLRKLIRTGKFKKLTHGTQEYARVLAQSGGWSPAQSFRPGTNPPIGSDFTVEQALANRLRDYNNTKKWVNKSFPDKKIQQLLIDEMVGSGILALDVQKSFYKHPTLSYRGDHIKNLVKKEREILLGNRTSQITGIATDLRTKLPSLITQSGAQGYNDGGMIPKFNQGNVVPGIGNTDTVPAMLTPGEFVVNKESTKNNYDLLTAINDGNISGFNKGGKIPGMQYFSLGGIAAFTRMVSKNLDTKISPSNLPKNVYKKLLRSVYQRKDEVLSGGDKVPTYKIQGSSYAFQGKGDDFSELVPKGITPVNTTPQSLLEEAIKLNPKDKSLQKMLENVKNKEFGKREIKLLDEISASISVNRRGRASHAENVDGYAMVLSSLSGNKNAKKLVAERTKNYYKIMADLRRKEQARLKQGLKEGLDRNPSRLIDEKTNRPMDVDPAGVTVFHATPYPVVRDADGSINILSQGSHNLGVHSSVPRPSVHTTLEAPVAPHMAMQMTGNENFVISRLSTMIKDNDVPRYINPTDTWWLKNPGQALKFSDASVVRPFTSKRIYDEELIKRGLGPVGTNSTPVIAVDPKTKDVLFLRKDEYSHEDRVLLAKLSDELEDIIPGALVRKRDPDSFIGFENSVLDSLSKQAAKKQIGISSPLENLSGPTLASPEASKRIGTLNYKYSRPDSLHAESSAVRLEMMANDRVRGIPNYVKHAATGGDLEPMRMAIASGSTASTRKLAPPTHGLRANKGTIVPGVGNTDTVPAMLTPGEFVVNKEATSQNRQLLEEINNSKKPQKLNMGGMAYSGSREAPPTLAMNSGGIAGVQYLRGGGIVKILADLVLGYGAYVGVKKGAEKAGASNTTGEIAGSVAGVGSYFALNKVLKMFSKNAAAASTSTSSVAAGAGKVAKHLGGFSQALKFAPGPLKIAVAAVAAISIPVKLVNDNLEKLSGSGAELSEAMHGSAKTVDAMAKAFGRETYATSLRRNALEKAVETSGGQEITPEAVAASEEFMKTDAGSELIKDMELVKKSGKDVSLALRNQLASSIMAGAITPEEAKAIAIDVGKAIKDEKVSIKVAGELSNLLGPNGEKILDNIVEITAEINPVIDYTRISRDAEKEFENLNPLQKMMFNLFKGGQDGYVTQASIATIAEENALSLSKEAEARAFLNIMNQEGAIGLEEYLDKEKEITSNAKERFSVLDSATAESLGFSDVSEMNLLLEKYLQNRNQPKIDIPTSKDGEMPDFDFEYLEQSTEDQEEFDKAMADGKKAFDAIISQRKKFLAEAFVYSGDSQEEADIKVSSIEENLAPIDPGIFDKFISGQIPLEGKDILLRLESAGDLTAEDIDRIGKELIAISTIPNIDKVLDFNMSNENDLTEIYDQYVALEKKPDLFKGISIKDQFSDTMSQFGIEYAWLASLPNQEKIILLRNIETFEKYNSLAELEKAAPGGYVEGATRRAQVTSAQSLKQNKETFGQAPVAEKPEKTSGGKGSQAEDKLKRLKDMLMERFRLQEMLIDKEEQGFYKRIKNISREIQLQQRQINLEEKQIEIRQKALEELSKKEDEVNTVYDNRVSALDRVSASNSRLANQEQSRITFASALASGNIAGAASAMSEMTQQSAESQIEDSRAALETQRETALKNLTVDVNGVLMTRKQIDESIEAIQVRIDVIQESIYQKNILIEGLEDELLKTEEKRLKVAEDREKIETRLYLLEQKKAINELNKKKIKKKLSPEEKQALADYKASYNSMATFYNQQNPNTPVQLLNRGGQVSGIGMTDKVPAMLTPGEFVIRKNAAKAFLPVLKSINSGLFPSVGGINLDSPRYDVPTNNITNVPVSQSVTNSSNASTMYNNSYSINVNVSGSNSSADEIANVVMGKIARSNSGSIRGSRY